MCINSDQMYNVPRNLRWGVVAACLVAGALAICPNRCSGNGKCSYTPDEICTCYPGFTGPDCSLKACPYGKTWAGFSQTTDGLHNQLSECSNMVMRRGSCGVAVTVCIFSAGIVVVRPYLEAAPAVCALVIVCRRFRMLRCSFHVMVWMACAVHRPLATHSSAMEFVVDSATCRAVPGFAGPVQSRNREMHLSQWFQRLRLRVQYVALSHHALPPFCVVTFGCLSLRPHPSDVPQ